MMSSPRKKEPGSSRPLTRAEQVEAIKEAAKERMRAHRKRWEEQLANTGGCEHMPGHRAECKSPATLQKRQVVTKEPDAGEVRKAVEAKPKRLRLRTGDETCEGQDQLMLANGYIRSYVNVEENFERFVTGGWRFCLVRSRRRVFVSPVQVLL